MRFDPLWPNNKVDRLQPRQKFLAYLGMGVVGGLLVTWFQWFLSRDNPGAVTWGWWGFVLWVVLSTSFGYLGSRHRSRNGPPEVTRYTKQR